MLRRFREIQEDVPTNSAGSGAIAGLPPDSPPGPAPIGAGKMMRRDRPKFAGCPVFEVDGETYAKCLRGKGRYDRYNKYFDVNEGVGKEIHEYGRKNGGRVILQHDKTGSMLYLRFFKHGS